MKSLQEIIEKAWNDRALLKEDKTQEAIRQVVDLLDEGKL
jgi:2,3,4,5-tetrahydropyridine-2-carboxylate N-succinyltransferase